MTDDAITVPVDQQIWTYPDLGVRIGVTALPAGTDPRLVSEGLHD
ncbi:hypothetical protein [Halosimplex rubrum]|nr:hypothetical protein [Halosimplex rubrum]